MRVLSREWSILGDERSLLVGKWSTNGKTEGVWDKNGTIMQGARKRKQGEEVRSGESESRARGSESRARRKRKQGEVEGSGWLVVQLWVGTDSELRSRWGEMEWVVVYWGR